MTEISVDLRQAGEPFRGWGTSLAWWAHGVGTWPEATVDEVVRLVTDPREGLGLTVFRYNIGGGDQPGHAHLRRWGEVPGFKASAESPYDWEADAAQRRVLLRLVAAAGKDVVVEAFSNSPPWWMTNSGCVAGAADGGANLRPEFESAFVEYLADVAAFYRDRHGVTFDTVEPMNEPDVKWWKAGGNQEGTHIPRDQQARLIRGLRAALDARGLRDTTVSATDANNLDDALTSLLGFDDATLAALGQVNAHTYSGMKRAELREAAAVRGKPLWQSESGPLYVGGTEYEQVLKMAERIVVDLNVLRPEVWCTWQVVAEREWGCLQEDPAAQTFRVGKMFHVFAAFTRGIRPGDRVVPTVSDRVLAAVSQARSEATLVLVNRDKGERAFRVRLAADESMPASADAVQTTAEADSATIEPVAVREGVIETTVPAESVTRLTLRLGE